LLVHGRRGVGRPGGAFFFAFSLPLRGRLLQMFFRCLHASGCLYLGLPINHH